MMVLKRRQIVFIALIIMILVAGYLNWSYQQEMETVPAMGDDIDNTTAKNLGEAQLVSNPVNQEDNVEKEEEQQIIVDAGSTNPYFIEARMEKETARGQAMEVLQGIVENQNSPEETKIKAQNEMIEMANNIDTEAIIENLIKAKGFEDVVAFINEGHVDIVVQSSGLIPSQVAQIMDIVVTQTSVDTDNIKIMEVK